MAKLEPTDVRFFATPAELRDWFDANHATAPELWLGYHKKGTGRPSVVWAQAVDEALCVGWIDGILKRLDETSHVQRFTPRRKGSNWSADQRRERRAAHRPRVGCGRPGSRRSRRGRRNGPAIYSYEREVEPFSEDGDRHGSGRTPRPGPTGSGARRRIAGARRTGSRAPSSRRRANAGWRR